MDLRISIANDQELRNAVKDILKGQLRALGRNEVASDAIASAAIQRIKNTSGPQIRAALNDAFGTGEIRKWFLEKQEERLDQWVEHFCTSRLEDMLSKVINEQVKTRIDQAVEKYFSTRGITLTLPTEEVKREY